MSSVLIHLYSFGFAHRTPPPDPYGHGGGFVFDCRGLPNPHWDEALRPYRGFDPPVQAFMEESPQVQAFARHSRALVEATIKAYQAQGYSHLMVAFGCTGGKHRSVWQAHSLCQHLSAQGHQTALCHLELTSPEKPSS